MSLRSFLYETLSNDPDIQALVQDRIIASGSLMTAQLARPFILVSLSANTDEQIFDDPDIVQRPSRQFFWVWVHDTKPSYLQVDVLCELVKNALRVTSSSPDDRLMAVRFIDQSADSTDPTLDTVFRYTRYQAILSQ